MIFSCQLFHNDIVFENTISYSDGSDIRPTTYFVGGLLAYYVELKVKSMLKVYRLKFVISKKHISTAP